MTPNNDATDTVRKAIGAANARRRSSPVKRIAGLLAILLAFLIVIPIVVLSTVGPSLWSALVPKTAATLEKRNRAELMRAYMSDVDTSITPIRAGDAFHTLSARTGVPMPPMMRPALLGPVSWPVPDIGIFLEARPDAWVGPSASHILEMAHKGFSKPELDYLTVLSALPVWEEYGIVAHARRMDLAGGTYVIPLPTNVSPFELPITKFAATKEVAYANTSRAALQLASGKPADAERTLRETISNGFRLMDDGNTLIDDLIGVVIIGIGRSALEQLYTITKNPELARIQAASAAFDNAHKAAPSAAGLTTPDRSAIITALGDTTQLRGVRYEYVLSLGFSPCTNTRELLFGTSTDITAALEHARGQLARTPAEEAMFDLNTHVLDRASGFASRNMETGIGPRMMLWIAHVPAFLLHNPRISNCAALATAVAKMN